jgi:hypothetical protein
MKPSKGVAKCRIRSQRANRQGLAAECPRLSGAGCRIRTRDPLITNPIETKSGEVAPHRGRVADRCFDSRYVEFDSTNACVTPLQSSRLSTTKQHTVPQISRTPDETSDARGLTSPPRAVASSACIGRVGPPILQLRRPSPPRSKHDPRRPGAPTFARGTQPCRSGHPFSQR